MLAEDLCPNQIVLLDNSYYMVTQTYTNLNNLYMALPVSYQFMFVSLHSGISFKFGHPGFLRRMVKVADTLEDFLQTQEKSVLDYRKEVPGC